ncbi:hypothetical protein BY996DRAFT_6418352 [Phakopsora pachyrhizi]|nr:hypothetical protein BY996DRAFT_6418352 [Phakopsora pachyrhizi]
MSDIIKNSQGSSKLIKSLVQISFKSTSKCGTVTEENSRGVDDPVCDLLQEPLALSEDDEPAELKKCSSILSSSSSSSSSNQKRPTRLGRLPRSNSSSTSFSIFGNNNINDDSTPRIRTRPSLTPSLMSDRSSSPFTEAEDDINEGFFDDIEFPPEFGIPNNLHPASTPSNPSSSLPSSKLHGPTESVHSSSSESSRIVESKSKKYLELQRSLNQVSSQSHQFGNHPSSSNHFSSTIRRNFRAYEDRRDERVEDGLEIEINSINPDKLRSRTSSTLSSGSSLHPHSLNFLITRHGHLPRHQPQRSSLENPSHAGFILSHQQGALHQQNKLKQMTVPFPSSTTNSTVSKTGESAVDKVPTNYKRSLSTRSSGSNIKSTSSSSSTCYSFPIVPHPAPHINRPTSTMTTSSSSRSIAVSIPHRPQSVATTSSTNSGRVKAAVSSNALSLAAPSPHSLKPPRLRTKSLKHTSSDPKIGDDHRPQSGLQHQASSSRVQSPSFGARGGGTREQSVCLN